jgi:hypothetical protein
MARQSRNRVLAFDFDEALAFEGDTGPYLQYSAVRAGKIFSKLAERRGEGPFSADELAALEGVEIPDDLWSLVFECARRREVVAQAVAGLEFSLLAQHVHGLAQLFHRLYHSNPVVPEEDATVRALRRAVFTVFVGEMRVLLEELLGIPIPEEMQRQRGPPGPADSGRGSDQQPAISVGDQRPAPAISNQRSATSNQGSAAATGGSDQPPGPGPDADHRP